MLFSTGHNLPPDREALPLNPRFAAYWISKHATAQHRDKPPPRR